MTRRILMTSLLAFSLLSVLAIPAKKGISKFITLTDGSTVKVCLAGDEYLHFWVDSLGNRYLPADSQGLYRLANGNDMAKGKARVHARTESTSARRARKLAANAAQGSFEGKKKGIVILVEYTDVSFKTTNPKERFDRIANEISYSEGSFNGSVKDYFLSQSRGTFELDFDIVGPVKLAHNMAYYGANDSWGNDLRPEMMVVEGCKAVDDEVNFADYDWDGDGKVDQVYIIYAGYGEADTYDKENTVWPHEWALSGSSITTPQTLDGVVVDTYACSSELNGSGKIDGIGTMCHEFSHCMGLPDMYDINYTGNFGMGPWDLMDSGSYNDDGYTPAGYSSYERMVCGWLSPVVVNKGDELAVSGMTALAEDGEAYMIANSGNPDEYFLVENRQRVAWDAALPASGVLVLHVDYDEKIWYYNLVNTTGRDSYSGVNNPHQRVTILHADNDDDKSYFNSYNYSYSKTTYYGDPYPYNGNDSITPTSVPSSSLYSANADGKKYLDVAIRNIAVAGDGTASMDFGECYVSEGGNGNGEDDDNGNYLFYETFDDCDGVGGTDNVFSGGTQIGNAKFQPDNQGWESTKAFGANQCAKFGTSSVVGSVTTPEIIIDGQATLTFRAVPWGSDGRTLTLSVSEGATISQESFTMSTGEWKDYTATITASGAVKIQFVPAKRFFLDDVKVTSVATSVQGISVGDVVPVAVYSVSGMQRKTIGKGINVVKYSDGSIRKVMQR